MNKMLIMILMFFSCVVLAQNNAHDKDKCQCIDFWLNNKAFNFPPMPSNAVPSGCLSWTDYNHYAWFGADWKLTNNSGGRYSLLAKFDRLGGYHCQASRNESGTIGTKDSTIDGIDGQLDFHRNPQEAANACAKYINAILQNKSCPIQKERPNP